MFIWEQSTTLCSAGGRQVLYRWTPTLLGILWLVLTLEGEELMGYCVFLWKEAKETELLT